ncbi:15533_t:CDS:2, partial [Dentiscutata erythropus]
LWSYSETPVGFSIRIKTILVNKASKLTESRIRDFNEKQERLKKKTEKLRKKFGEHDAAW